MASELTLRDWLLAEIPLSKSQARCQRIFISWLAFKQNPVAVIGLLIVASLVAIAALAPWITASDGLELHLSERLIAPGSEYWFGTDQFGRDILTRIIYGSRTALFVGFSCAFVGAFSGLVLGVAH